MASQLVGGSLASIDRGRDPLDGIDARLVRFDRDRAVTIQVIDDGGVELLLLREHAREQPPRRRREARREAALLGRAIDDLIERIETFDLKAIRRRNR